MPALDGIIITITKGGAFNPTKLAEMVEYYEY